MISEKKQYRGNLVSRKVSQNIMRHLKEKISYFKKKVLFHAFMVFLLNFILVAFNSSLLNLLALMSWIVSQCNALEDTTV